MTEQERLKEKLEFGGLGTTLFCVGTIAAALWGMKKISESARNTKLTWREFLFPKKSSA